MFVSGRTDLCCFVRYPADEPIALRWGQPVRLPIDAACDSETDELQGINTSICIPLLSEIAIFCGLGLVRGLVLWFGFGSLSTVCLMSEIQVLSSLWDVMTVDAIHDSELLQLFETLRVMLVTHWNKKLLLTTLVAGPFLKAYTASLWLQIWCHFPEWSLESALPNLGCL